MSASRCRDDRGLTIPLLALLIGTLVLMVSFAVDLGRQRADRRLAQAGADVVALDMMREVQGRTFGTLETEPVRSEVLAALTRSATDNGFENAVASVVDSEEPRITAIRWGEVPGLLSGNNEFIPFVAGTDDDRVPTAVQIQAERTTDYFFQPGDGPVTRLAVAAFPSPDVDLAVGSIGAGLDPTYPHAFASVDVTARILGRRLHRQFNASTPTPDTSFDLVGYRGLAAADVELRKIAANAGFGSPNEMLDSGMTVGQFFSATATALDQQAAEGDPNAANAAAELRRFQTGMGVDSSGQIDMGEALHYAQGGDDAAATGSVNLLDLLSGTANVIDGANFVNYSFTSDIAFPAGGGFVTADVTQHVVEPEKREFNLGIGGTATNTQARFQIDLRVAPLTGMNANAPVTIPLVVEAATATGEVDRMDCADPLADSEAEIDVTTSGVTVRVGTASDLTASSLVVTPGVLVQGSAGLLNSSVFVSLGLTPLQILSLDLNGGLTATGSASVLGGFSELTFQATPDDPDDVAYQRAPGGVGATSIGTQLQSTLDATLGSGALGPSVDTALATQLGYLFTNLQNSILNPILQQAGVTVAGADVKAWDLECEGAGLKLVG